MEKTSVPDVERGAILRFGLLGTEACNQDDEDTDNNCRAADAISRAEILILENFMKMPTFDEDQMIHHAMYAATPRELPPLATYLQAQLYNFVSFRICCI